jgi:biofilm PGA synthesis N-glycosyltransferase PgaC
MKWVFWFSICLIAYAYFGYPVWLCVQTRFRPRPGVRSASIFPAVSVVMAVRNSADLILRKLRNLSELNYPADRLEVVIVSDGSTDKTNQTLTAIANDRIRVLISPDHRGKAWALNEGIRAAGGEIVVFTDARQLIEPDAVAQLVSDFADPSVGCVSGELMLDQVVADSRGTGIGLYWQMEKKIRRWEAAAKSVVGATGGLYAARKELLPSLPEETILDDVYIPMHIARQGARVIFEPRARAWDDLAFSSKREFRRKVRTLTGNYQLLRLAPWLLGPSNPLLVEFISHKLLRLLVPFALVALFISSFSIPVTFYKLAFGIQLACAALAILGILRPRHGLLSRLGFLSRLEDISLTFFVLNTAALVAFVYFVTGKKQVWAQ